MGGFGKNQNSGPYYSNGYRPDPTISHLDFSVGSQVIYTGTNKNKNMNYIPNGTIGEIMEKDNSSKLQKSSRSTLKVDFGSKGIRYVNKNVLQLSDSFEENQEYVLETMDTEGLQSYRNDKKKEVNEQLRPAKYDKILSNRQKNKEFREWRKDFLDEKHLSIKDDINQLINSSDYAQKLKSRKDCNKEIDELQDKYSLVGEPKTKMDFMNEQISKGVSSERAERIYSLKKQGADKKIKHLKKELKKLNEFFYNSSDKIKKLREVMDREDRQFVYEVNDKNDYNTYLQHHYEQRNKVDKVEYDYKKYLLEPSEEYKIDSNVKAIESENINLLRWGLYPHQVC